MEINESSLKRSRTLYIIEAALEYLVSLSVTGSFLATITGELGISDSLTGILSSIISLGCIFQLMSVFVRRKRVKTFVLIFSILDQLLFASLYVIPLFNVPQIVKTVLFVIFIIGAYVVYNIANPKKIAWLMSLVDDDKRGIFTAHKEMISLASGMIFSFAMGALIDYFKDNGQTRIAFIISACVIFILMIFHSMTLFFAVEKDTEDEDEEKTGVLESFATVLKDKNIVRVTFIYIFYRVSHYVAVPFYSTYMINDLGFSLKTTAALTIGSSIVRILVSTALGRYGDRKSFAALMDLCLGFLGISYMFVCFATPKNGLVMFIMYNVFNGIAMGGINGALTNLVFDFAPIERRADSLVVCQSISGVLGFLATLAMSPLVDFIQSSGNRFLGIDIYAQQLVSIISLIITVIAIIYVRVTILKKHKTI